MRFRSSGGVRLLFFLTRPTRQGATTFPQRKAQRCARMRSSFMVMQPSALAGPHQRLEPHPNGPGHAAKRLQKPSCVDVEGTQNRNNA